MKYFSLDGRQHNQLLDSLLARLFQHEIDHLHAHVPWNSPATHLFEQALISDDITTAPSRLQEVKEVSAVDDKFVRDQQKYIIDF